MYEVTPSERAAIGNRQLALLRPRPYGSLVDNQHHYQSGSYYSDPTFQCSKRWTRPEWNHHPRNHELPVVTTGPREACINVWDKVSRNLKRSASSAASLDHLASDRPGCFRNSYCRSRVAPPLDDYLNAADVIHGLKFEDEDEPDVMIDFVPSLEWLHPYSHDSTCILFYLLCVCECVCVCLILVPLLRNVHCILPFSLYTYFSAWIIESTKLTHCILYCLSRALPCVLWTLYIPCWWRDAVSLLEGENHWTFELLRCLAVVTMVHSSRQRKISKL